jgi:hypothetical protein
MTYHAGFSVETSASASSGGFSLIQLVLLGLVLLLLATYLWDSDEDDYEVVAVHLATPTATPVPTANVHVDDELSRIAREIGAIQPAGVTSNPFTAAASPASRKRHIKHCGCSRCRVWNPSARYAERPKPMCASVMMPLDKINFQNYNTWNPYKPCPWKNPALKMHHVRPNFTAAPIDWALEPPRVGAKACHASV